MLISRDPSASPPPRRRSLQVSVHVAGAPEKDTEAEACRVSSSPWHYTRTHAGHAQYRASSTGRSQ